jgi:hypothetical protein
MTLESEKKSVRKSNLPPGPGPGRPKGIPNKVTTIAKNVIADAADRLGGVDRLVAWAQEDAKNERAFWTALYPKLIPVQVEGPGDNGEHLIQTITRRIIDPKSDGKS